MRGRMNLRRVLSSILAILMTFSTVFTTNFTFVKAEEGDTPTYTLKLSNCEDATGDNTERLSVVYFYVQEDGTIVGEDSDSPASVFNGDAVNLDYTKGELHVKATVGADEQLEGAQLKMDDAEATAFDNEMLSDLLSEDGLALEANHSYELEHIDLVRQEEVENVDDTFNVGLFKTNEFDLSQMISSENPVDFSEDGVKIYLLHDADDTENYDYVFNLVDYSIGSGEDNIRKTSEDADWQDNEYISFSDDLTEITLKSSKTVGDFSLNVEVVKTNKTTGESKSLGTWGVDGTVIGFEECDYLNGGESDRIAYFSTEKGGEPVSGEIYNVPNKGLTLYMNAYSKDNLSDVRILGYYMGDPGWDGKTQKYTNLKTANYDVLKYNATDKSITVPEDFEYWEIGFVTQYTYKTDKHVEYEDVNLFIRRSDKGLVCLDMLDMDWGSEGPIWDTIQPWHAEGYATGATFSKVIWDTYKGSAYVLLGECQDDAMMLANYENPTNPDFGNISLNPSTNRADYTIKKLVGNSWVNTNELELVYEGDNEGVPSVYKNALWQIHYNGVGYYRIIAKDGTYFNVNVTLPNVGFYTSNTKFDTSTYAGFETFASAGTNKTLWLYANAFQEGGYYGGATPTLTTVTIVNNNGPGNVYSIANPDSAKAEFNTNPGWITYDELGNPVSVDLSEYFDITQVGDTKDLFKVTLKKTDCFYEFAFDFSYVQQVEWYSDEGFHCSIDYSIDDKGKVSWNPDDAPDGRVEVIYGNDPYITSIWNNPSQKGLVINSAVEFDERVLSDHVPMNDPVSGYENAYYKEAIMSIMDPFQFFLVNNKSEGYVNENSVIEKLASTKNIAVQKYDEAKNEWITADSGNYSFKYLDKSVFELVVNESGTYRLLYRDGSFVKIYAMNPVISFFDSSAYHKDERPDYIFEQTNKIDGITLTPEEAAKGSKTFYLVVDKNCIDTSSYFINVYALKGNNRYCLSGTNPTMVEGITASGIVHIQEMISYFGENRSSMYDGDLQVYSIKLQDTENINISDYSFEVEIVSGEDGEIFYSTQSPFEINKCDLEDCEITSEFDEITCDGTIKQAEPTAVSIGNIELDSSDCSIVEWRNNINVGKAKAIMEGRGNFTGKVEIPFEIKPLKLSDYENEFRPAAIYTKSGPNNILRDIPFFYDAVRADIKYEFGYEKSGDKYVSASKLAAGNTYYLKVSGKGNVDSTPIYIPYTYEQGSIDDAQIVGDGYYYTTYNGKAQLAKPVIKDNGVLLVEGVDYVVRPETNDGDVNAGEYGQVIEGINNYKGTQYITLVINPASISQAKVTGVPTSIKYLGDYDAVNPKVVLNKELTEDDDYICTFDFSCVGKGTVTIEGIGNYTGKITKSVNVTATSQIKSAKIKPGTVFTFDGQPKELTPDDLIVMGTSGEVDGTCYNISSTGVNAGKVTATITGKAEKGFSGKVTVSYTIAPAVVTEDMIQVAGVCEYSPKATNKLPVTITLGDYVGVEGKDYTLSYTNTKKVGEVTVTIKTKGNFAQGTFTKKYTINQCDLNGDFVTASCPEVVYGDRNGQQVKPNVVFTHSDNATLTEGVDYYLSKIEVFKDSDYVETETIVVDSLFDRQLYRLTYSGKGNYDGDVVFEIFTEVYQKISIKNFTVEGIPESRDYTGSEQYVDVKVNDGENELSSDWYKVDYSNNINAGKAYVTITGLDDYEGTITKCFMINPIPGEEHVGIDCETPYIDENGKVVFPSFNLYDDDYELIEKQDYTYKYVKANAIHGEEAKVEVTFKGNYSGKAVYSLGKIEGLCIDPVNIQVTGVKDFVYTGKDVKQKLTVKYKGKTLKEGTDYTIKYSDIPNEVGEHVFEVQSCGKYQTYSIYIGSFEVTRAPITKATVTLKSGKITYNPSDLENPNFVGYGDGIVTSVKYNGVSLKKDEDYIVDTSNDCKPGTAYVILQGTGNFEGEIVKTFKIDGKVNINDDDIEVEVEREAFYSPAGAKPITAVRYNGVLLEEDKDYTLVCTNNKKLSGKGEVATVQIKGKGNYTGTYAVTYNFKVVKGDLAVLDSGLERVTFNATYSELAYYYGTIYNAKEQIPDPKVKVDNKALKMGVDYKVTYQDMGNGSVSDSVVNAGDYFVIIEGIGNYEGVIESVIYLYVAQADINKAKIKTVSKVEYVECVGTKPSQKIVTQVIFNGVELSDATDYFVSYDYTYTESMDNELSQFYNDVLKIKFPACEETEQIEDWYLPGKHTAYLCGMFTKDQGSNFTGIKKISYTINGYDLSKAKVNNPISSIDYIPEAEHVVSGELQNITLDYVVDGKTVKLKYGVDYEMSDIVNKVGNATVTFTGKGMFTGKTKTTVKINPLEPDIKNIVYSLCQQYDVNGTKLKDLEVGYYGIRLEEGKDYTVSYANNKAVSTPTGKKPTATIKFKGNYTGSVTVNYEIEEKCICDSDITVTFKDNRNTYKPALTVKQGATALKVNQDYKVTYYFDDSNGFGTIAKVGKQYVRYNYGDIIPSNATLLPGTRVKVDIEGIGNYYGTEAYSYVYTTDCPISYWEDMKS